MLSAAGGEGTPKKIKSKHLIDTNAIKQRNYISQIQNIEGTYKRKKNTTFRFIVIFEAYSTKNDNILLYLKNNLSCDMMMKL